ncbi:Mucin-associated surface protein (MASP) [Trypanosoma cruzi]|uniref:Mucin-associated surface protein (MASP) n=1 Tax=Trypanosoma cruzi TaxID=5693 RepID=A0A2V2XIV7_TRYCR|nr:Mucin-associated surface protein (MASP) [Trypanosoma cruzi]
MAMMMAGRVLLVCALCVLWCGAGGIHARNPDNNSLGGCIASGVLGENQFHLSSGCEKTVIKVTLLSKLPIPAVESSTEDSIVSAVNDLGSSENSIRGESGLAGAGIPVAGGPAALPGAGGGGGSGSVVTGGTASGGDSAGDVPSGPSGGGVGGKNDSAGLPSSSGVDSTPGSSDGEAGSPNSNSSNTVGESPREDQSPDATGTHNSSPPDEPAGMKSSNEHARQEKEEKEQEQHEHPAENGEESAKDKNAVGKNTTANTDKVDSSTAVSHTTSPLLLLVVVVCATAAAVVVAGPA